LGGNPGKGKKKKAKGKKGKTGPVAQKVELPIRIKISVDGKGKRRPRDRKYPKKGEDILSATASAYGTTEKRRKVGRRLMTRVFREELFCITASGTRVVRGDGKKKWGQV